jgi:hypothetical protein
MLFMEEGVRGRRFFSISSSPQPSPPLKAWRRGGVLCGV